MIDLLAVPELVVRVVAGAPPSWVVAEPGDGQPLATAAVRPSVEARVRRLLASRVSWPFTIELRDPAGGVVLTCAQRRRRLRGGLDIAVRLADSRPVGAAHAGSMLSGEVELHDAAGRILASAPTTRYRGWEVSEGPGIPLATVDLHTVPIARRTADDPVRTYRLTWRDDTTLPVRAVTVALLLCTDATTFPRARGAS